MATERQKKVVKEMLANGGSTKQIMKKAGYSDAYAKNPHKMRKTKSFQELMDKYLPEDDVAKVHQELLHKRGEYVINGKIVKSDQPHADAKAAIDMSYKLRGTYEAEKVVIENQIRNMTETELDDELAKLEEQERESDRGSEGKKTTAKGRKTTKKKA